MNQAEKQGKENAQTSSEGVWSDPEIAKMRGKKVASKRHRESLKEIRRRQA
jgi:hypothetical protein